MQYNLASPLLFLSLLALAALGTGCSVLGIATKGDLEAQRQAQVAQAEALQKELAEITEGMEAFRNALDLRLASMQEELAAVEQVRGDLAALEKRLEVAQQEFTILQGKVGQDLARIQGEVSGAAQRAQDAHSAAYLADARGQRVVDSMLESLRNDRNQLRRQLDEVEELLASWSEWEARVGAGVTKPTLTQGGAAKR